MPGPKLLDEWIAAATESPILSLGRHTSVVAKIKYLLVVGVVILLSSLIIWPLLYSVDQPLKLTFNAVQTKEAEPKKMINPRFRGIDKYNRPFNIRADEALQKSETLIDLKNISGDMAMESNRWLMLESSSGEADTDNQQLHLFGTVKFFTSDGYEVDSTDVSADLDDAYAKSVVPVHIQGPAGILNGSGFYLDVNAQKLDINGRVHVTLYPKEANNP